jgi:hypothetical protein
MTIPLDKILTVSAEEYCKSEHVDLGDYRLEGVHVTVNMEEREYLLRYFSREVPAEAVVVTGYTPCISFGNGPFDSPEFIGYASGTALIPRDNSNQIRDDNNLNVADNDRNRGN